MIIKFKSVTILQEKHRSSWMDHCTEYTCLYDLTDVLDHEYDDGKDAGRDLFIWLVLGLVGALIGAVVTLACGSKIWSTVFFIVGIAGFFVVFFTAAALFDNFQIRPIAKKERRKKGKSLKFHIVADEDWGNFLKSLKRV